MRQLGTGSGESWAPCSHLARAAPGSSRRRVRCKDAGGTSPERPQVQQVADQEQQPLEQVGAALVADGETTAAR